MGRLERAWSRLTFEPFEGYRDVRRRQKHEHFLLRIYHKGFNARMAGYPCEPPNSGNLAQRWTEGWEAADRDIDG